MIFLHLSPRQNSEDGGWMGYLTKAVSASANYLPSQVTDVFSQGRAFASVRLPFQGVKNVCAITTYVYIIIVIINYFFIKHPNPIANSNFKNHYFCKFLTDIFFTMDKIQSVKNDFVFIFCYQN